MFQTQSKKKLRRCGESRLFYTRISHADQAVETLAQYRNLNLTDASGYALLHVIIKKCIQMMSIRKRSMFDATI